MMKFRRRRHHDEFDAELQSHIEMHLADNMRAGMAPDESAAPGADCAGGVEQTKERYANGAIPVWLDELSQDLRFATRVAERAWLHPERHRRARLGIGANALFFRCRALILSPLPFHESPRLV